MLFISEVVLFLACTDLFWLVILCYMSLIGVKFNCLAGYRFGLSWFSVWFYLVFGLVLSVVVSLVLAYSWFGFWRASMAKWLELLTNRITCPPLYCCGFESCHGPMDSFMWGSHHYNLYSDGVKPNKKKSWLSVWFHFCFYWLYLLECFIF